MTETAVNTFGINIIPENEEQRLEALRRYNILDTPPDEAFNDLAHLIAQYFEIPIALISLVDKHRVHFKGNVGMEGVKNVDRGVSLCSLAILSDEPNIIEDPQEDPCLLANPLVHGQFGLRFYAGAPLITPEGFNIGTVCIVDKKERTFSKREQDQLVRFAKLAMHEIELRRSALLHVNMAIDVLDREKSFRTLAQNSPDMIVRHGKDFRYQYANPMVEKLTGKKPEEVIGRSYWEMGIPGHLCRLFDKSLALVFATKLLQHIEYTLQTDREIHVYSRLVPEFDESGEVVSVMAIATDITERKSAESALEYQKTLLETVTQNTTLALFMLDEERRCVYMNEAAEHMTGFSFEEIKGKNLHYQIHKTYPDGTHYPIEKCPFVCASPKTEQVEGEEVFIHKNGSYFNVAYTASPIIINGELHGRVLEVKDITEEKKKEQALRESENRFQQMANTLPLVVWTASPQGSLTYISNQWEENFGNPIAESLGMGWVKFVHPDDIKRAAKKWEHSVRTRENYEIDLRVLHKNEGYRWLLVRAVSICNSHGAIVNWYGSNTDIEEKKKAEEILEQKVKERTTELEQRNKELEQFTYVSHHDLQEPLRKIMMFSGMVESEAVDKLSNTAQIRLRKVTESARRMSKALRDVLDFASLNKEEQFSQVDLNDTIAAVQTDLELAIQDKNATLTVAPLPIIKAIPVQMHQLFYNLVNNALKFSKAGLSPDITISWQKIAGDSVAKQYNLDIAKDYCQITVRDNGIGFNNYAAEKIFGLFQRLHSKQEYAGTGIGLAMAQKVVQNHGGRIWAESEPGIGSTFTILLPHAGTHFSGFKKSVLSTYNVKVTGKGTQTLVFAHGLGCDHNVWRYVSAAFEKDYQIVTFDYIGSGDADSSKYSKEKYSSMNGYAQDVLDICHALALQSVIFIGHSVSSMIGMLAAIQEPSLFLKIVMIGASPKYINDPPYLGGFNEEEVEQLLTLMRDNYVQWTQWFASKAMANSDKPELSDKLQNIFSSVNPAIMYDFARMTFFADKRKDLCKLTIPTLILQTDNDIVAPRHIGEFVHRSIPYSTLYYMKATGHYPHLSAVEETVGMIKKYLEEE